MKFYYQYDKDGNISAVVKSNRKPNHARQIVLDGALADGKKTYSEETKEVTFYKDVYNRDGEFVKTIVDINKPRTKIN